MTSQLDSNSVCDEQLPSRFTHGGISYDHAKRKIIFSHEASEALETVIRSIQLKLGNEDSLSQNQGTNMITNETIDAVADTMILEGATRKAVKKFLNKIKSALKKNKMSKKIQDTVSGLNVSSPRHELYVEVLQGATEIKILVPIIIHPGRPVDDLIRSFNTRLANTKHFL